MKYSSVDCQLLRSSYLYPRRYTGDHLRLNMSDNEDEQPNPPPPLPPPQAQGTVKLSPFWPQAPALWFAQAECTFAVKHVTGQFERYCHVVAALPHESLRMDLYPRRYRRLFSGLFRILNCPLNSKSCTEIDALGKWA